MDNVKKRIDAICDFKDEMNKLMHNTIKEMNDIKLNEIPAVKGLPQGFIDELNNTISDTKYSIETTQSEISEAEDCVNNAYSTLDDVKTGLESIQEIVGEYQKETKPEAKETDAMSKTTVVTSVAL